MDFIKPEKMEFIQTIDSEEILLTHIRYITQKIAGEKFINTPGIQRVISGLIYYFNGNIELAKKYKMDVCKGIALIGKYGTGKTTIFRIIHEYLRKTAPSTKNNFKITSVDEIIQTMLSSDNSMDGVYFYNIKPGLNNEQTRKPIHLCINEFGVQYDIKQFGSDVNDLIDSLMMRRYEIFQQYGKVTHITSNFGTDDFEKRFPERLVDRFREMFNIVKLEGKSFRK
jgi:DNA replication protein DnaC